MNLKEKLKLSNLQLAVLCVAVLLTIFGIVETILHIGADVPTSKTMFVCLSYLVILYYTFFGYKVPHGNLLKYIILFFALMLVNALALEAGGKYQGLDQKAVLYSSMVTGIVIVLVSYLAGKLGKFDKTIILCAVVLVLLIVRAILMSGYRTLMFTGFADVIIWLDINCAYALRYKQHREAGLQS